MFNLTSNERRAIILTAFVILAASSIQILQPHIEKKNVLDYRVSDSIFSRLSYTDTINKSQDIDIINTRTSGNETESITSTNKRNTTNSPSSFPKLASIDINCASSQELQQLPRIGPAMARRIIEYRERNGPFQSYKDLLKVKGIGKKTLEKIKPYIKI